MQQLKQIVQRLLEQQPELRDNDNALMVEIWRKESTQIDFFYAFISGYLTSPESIRRARQQLQQHHEHLRGELYELRHKFQNKVKKDLGYDVPMSYI